MENETDKKIHFAKCFLKPGSKSERGEGKES